MKGEFATRIERVLQIMDEMKTEIDCMNTLYLSETRREGGTETSKENISSTTTKRQLPSRSMYNIELPLEGVKSHFILTQASCSECEGALKSLLKHVEGSHNDLYRQMRRNGAPRSAVPKIKNVKIDNSVKINNCVNIDNSVTSHFQGDSDQPSHEQVPEPPAHAGEAKRRHACEECDRSFKKEWLLKRHRLVHGGQKPFQCDQCDRTFSQRVHFKTHMRTHTGVTPFRCTQCGKGFYDKQTLKRHGRVHSAERPYRCEECNKSFRQRDYLRTHQRLHTGEKPFDCTLCGKSFNQSGTLLRHKRTHSAGDGPFYCRRCHQGFVGLVHLRAHQCLPHTGGDLSTANVLSRDSQSLLS